MKIFYIGQFPIPSLYANSVQVVKMCAAFAEVGHQVVLLIPGDPRSAPDIDGICKHYGVPNAFQVDHVAHGDYRWASHVYAGRAVRKALNHRPDLIYSRVAAACCIAGAFNCPTIYESHMPVRGIVSRVSFQLLVRFYSFKRLVCISQSLADYYQTTYGLPATHIVVAHDGADIQCPDIDHLSVPANQSGAPHIGYFGSLGSRESGRGIDLIQMLAKHFPAAQFDIVGGNPGEVIYWKNTIGLPNVTFHGRLPHSSLPEMYRKCDILLAPYQRKVVVVGGTDTSSWMSPLKIFEYMAAGKATVCSDITVLREVLEPDRTALLVSPDNLDAWIMALTRLIGDAALRERLGNAAQREFETKYTWGQRARKVLA